MKKVLVTSNSFGKYSNEAQELLENHGFQVILNPYGRMLQEHEFLELSADVDAIILSTEQVNKTIIDNARHLKVVSRYGVGTDNIDRLYCEAKGIAVTITKDANANAVAEYAVGLMLNASRLIAPSNSAAHNNKWYKRTGYDLAGKTVGIIGLGSIGKRVAQKLSGFSAKLIAYDVYYDEAFLCEHTIQKSSLETLIQTSDVITLHLPGTEGVLLDQQAFAMMKQSVVIVNTARASLIDMDALCEYLENKKIHAVALDVHKDEPHFDQRLLGRENVILTAHTAAVSVESVNRMSLMAAQNILENMEE